jgi:hypothetical protein
VKPARKSKEEVVEEADATLLDIIDNLLTKGVMVNGEVVLGVADVDLIYLRLSAILCAADRILAPREGNRRGTGA